MVLLPVVVRHELIEGAEQPPLPEQDQVVETLRPDGAHEALRIGVAFGAWTGVSTIRTPAPWMVWRNPSVHFRARSQMSTRWSLGNAPNRIGRAASSPRHEPRL